MMTRTCGNDNDELSSCDLEFRRGAGDCKPIVLRRSHCKPYPPPCDLTVFKCHRFCVTITLRRWKSCEPCLRAPNHPCLTGEERPLPLYLQPVDVCRLPGRFIDAKPPDTEFNRFCVQPTRRRREVTNLPGRFLNAPVGFDIYKHVCNVARKPKCRSPFVLMNLPGPLSAPPCGVIEDNWDYDQDVDPGYEYPEDGPYGDQGDELEGGYPEEIYPERDYSEPPDMEYEDDDDYG